MPAAFIVEREEQSAKEERSGCEVSDEEESVEAVIGPAVNDVDVCSKNGGIDFFYLSFCTFISILLILFITQKPS